jgi:hypothetical protein
MTARPTITLGSPLKLNIAAVGSGLGCIQSTVDLAVCPARMIGRQLAA